MKDYKPKKISLRKLKRDARGISPIVATLMLVLITVAAATAFFVFESGWQKTVTGNVGNGTETSTQLTMTGSTTVTDLMNTMVPAFEQNNSGFKVSYTGTGSGAGLVAIEDGAVNMGMISLDANSITPGTTTSYPNLVQTIVAYDGVSIFLAQSTLAAHGISLTGAINMNQNIADAIWQVNVPTGGFTEAQLGITTVLPSWIAPATSGVISTWGDFETVLLAQGVISAMPTDAHAGIAMNVYFRSDSSGTQDAFSIKALGSSATAKFLPYKTPTTTQIGENGNPAMVSAVMADNMGIGFATTGMVSTTSGAVQCNWNNVAPSYKTIIDNVDIANDGKSAASTYTLWHPLIIVTNGAPTTDVKSFIDFITAPDNNIALCHAAGFTSIYESV